MKNPLEIYEQFEPSYSLIKEGYNLFDSYITKKHKERVEIFHRQILEGNASEEKIKYEQEYIKANPHDYFTLLKYTVEDDEKEKASIYSNIYSYFRDNQDIDKEDKYRLIRIANELTFSAIRILVKIYIYMNFHTKNKSLDLYFKEIEKNSKYELRILEQCSILTLPGGQIRFSDSQIEIEKLRFSQVIKAFFKDSDLIPNLYNIDMWENINVLILSDDPFGEGADIDYCKQTLNNYNIFPEIMVYQKIDFSSFAYIICIINNTNFENKNLLSSYGLDKLEINTKIMKVTMSKNIKDSDNILNLNNEKDKKKFRNIFSEKLEK